jgi:beta-alanine degradation protein BauB
MSDPTVSNPDQYRMLWENEFVRVLEYSDVPGVVTTPHAHPNSVMVTLSSFSRRLMSGGVTRDVELAAGQAVWLAAQEHAGSNIGDTPTHTIFIELKGAAAERPSDGGDLGPSRN